MTDRLKIAIAQVNPTVGAVTENADKVLDFRARAAAERADLVVYSEMTLTGYPPEDLVLKPALQKAVNGAVDRLAKATGDGGPAMIVSAPRKANGKLRNAAFVLDRGEIATYREKHHLPNYGVFDEKRVFEEGPMPGPVNFRDVRLGVMTCEDMWFPDVTECLAETGAEILIVPNGSPYELGKIDQRLQVGVARVTESGLPLIFINQAGGQDELVFDGTSFVLNADRSLAAQLPSFRESLAFTEWRRHNDGWRAVKGEIATPPEGEEEIYEALVLGLGDYVRKNGFSKVIVGLSGGIDSALTAAIAVDALGADQVRAVMMPSRYTSDMSLRDAKECADLLGIRYDIVGIEPTVDAVGDSLAPLFEGTAPGTAEENIQARIRGLILMALSNKFGHMLVATGNKSEMSVGYATLYGDLCGGFALLKDVYKTQVYALSRWRNSRKISVALGPDGRVIPEEIITRPPSAELAADQTDQDTLPPYDVLDPILADLIEGDKSITDIAAKGYDAATVARVEHMLYVAEYKRRQAPPGVKITRKLFGRDRRYPITNRFRDPADPDAGEGEA